MPIHASSKSGSSRDHPTLRKEGKAQNLHIQMKPMSSSSSKGISKAQAAKNFKHNKTLFPRMTIVSGKSQGDPSITIEPIVPTAFVDDMEEDSEEDNSNAMKNANDAEKKPSKPSDTNDDEEEEDDEDEEDEEGDGNEDDDDNEEEEEEDDDDDEDEDEEEEEEEEMKVKEDTNVPGSLHTQYPGNFRVPDVYQTNAKSSSSHETREPKRKTSTASPVAPPAAPLAVSKPTNLTPGKERALKQIILYKMGMVTPEDKKEEYAKLYTVKNSLTDLQDVYNQLKVAASMNKSINWSKQICNLAVQGFETLMMKQKVVDLSLMEGWAMNTTLMLEDGEFDDMLSEMVGGSAADYHPLTRIGITLFFGGVGYYFTQKATRKHVGPTMGPSSFVNPMTSFMNAQAANAAPMGVPPGAQTNARPWYPPAVHNPVPPPQPVHVHHHPSEQPQPMHPMSHEQIRRQQTSASEMQQKVHEREQARQQQSRASMLSSPKMAVPETTTARDMKLSDPVVDVPTISSMNNAAHRYTADKIKDYDEGKPNAVPKRKRPSSAGSDSDDPAVASKWRKLRTPKVSDDDEDDEDEEEDSEDGDEDSSEDDDEEEENEIPVSKRSRTQSNGKTKTASMLGSATLQAKIQKAMAMQKQARSDSLTGVSEQEPARANAIGTAAIPVTSAYVPLKRQTVDGPPPPVDPRGGETMSMFSSESIDPAQLAPLSSMVPVL